MATNLSSSLALERWAAGCKTLPLSRLFALQTAVSAESCYQMCHFARERAWFRLAGGLVDVSRWRRFYRSTEVFDLSFAAPLAVGTTDKQEVSAFRREMAKMLRELRSPSKDIRAQLRGLTRDDLAQGLQFWRDLETEFFVDYRADLDGAMELPPDFGNAAATPESLFFYMVAMPCWFEYGEPIGSLYGRVLDGDFDALCCLLRLDKFAFRLPEVRACYEAILQGGDSHRATLLLKAQEESPSPRLTERDVYLRVSGLLYDTLNEIDQGLKPLREAMDHAGVKRIHWPYARLSYNQILALFDAVLEDRKRGDDAHLTAESPEAFKQALHRKRDFWKGLPFAA